MFNKILNAKHELIALFFTIQGLYLRFQRLNQRELWIDETNQINATLGPLKPFWTRAHYAELTHFPGEYLLNYTYVQYFQYNKWGIAIPHIIITIIGFLLLYLICKRHFNTAIGTFLTFAFVANNHNLVFHSFEFRPYAVLPTLSLACFYLSENMISNRKEQSKLITFFTFLFFFICSIYHAYGFVMIAICTLFWLGVDLKGKSYKQLFKDHLSYILNLMVFTVPFFLWYAWPSIFFKKDMFININTFDYIPNPTERFGSFLRNIFGNMMGFKAFKIKATFYGIWVSFLIPDRNRNNRIAFFLILIALPLLFILYSDVKKGYWFLQRQYVWLMPYFAFLIGLSWEAIQDFLTSKLKRTKS